MRYSERALDNLQCMHVEEVSARLRAWQTVVDEVEQGFLDVSWMLGEKREVAAKRRLECPGMTERPNARAEDADGRINLRGEERSGCLVGYRSVCAHDHVGGGGDNRARLIGAWYDLRPRK